MILVSMTRNISAGAVTGGMRLLIWNNLRRRSPGVPCSKKLLSGMRRFVLVRLRILMCLNTAMSRRATRIKEQEGGFSDAIKQSM